jgi:hypothetical protein
MYGKQLIYCAFFVVRPIKTHGKKFLCCGPEIKRTTMLDFLVVLICGVAVLLSCKLESTAVSASCTNPYLLSIKAVITFFIKKYLAAMLYYW